MFSPLPNYPTNPIRKGPRYYIISDPSIYRMAADGLNRLGMMSETIDAAYMVGHAAYSLMNEGAYGTSREFVDDVIETVNQEVAQGVYQRAHGTQSEDYWLEKVTELTDLYLKLHGALLLQIQDRWGRQFDEPDGDYYWVLKERRGRFLIFERE